MSKKGNRARRRADGGRRRQAPASSMARDEERRRQADATRRARASAAVDGTRRTFTRGAKAVLASAAIMVMFVAGLVSWGVMRTARGRHADDDARDARTAMVSDMMVTGMSRADMAALDSAGRFDGFMASPGGVDGADLLGGRTPQALAALFAEERDELMRLWDERMAEEAEAAERVEALASGDAFGQAGGQSAADARRDARDRQQQGGDGTAAADGDPDGESVGDAPGTAATDEQVARLIESARDSSGR